jgi:hypothetical protein
MTPLASLWLPIVLSTVFIFIASSLIHMVLPWHKGDFAKLPDEEGFRRGVGSQAIPPNDYMVPYCSSSKEMQSPEYKAKMEAGPNILMTVRPNGMPSMGPMFIGWTLAILVVTAVVAWVTGNALPPGATMRMVCRFAFPVALLAYGFGSWPVSIWFGRKWSSAIKDTFDAAIYAAITCVTFGWLWPVP